MVEYELSPRQTIAFTDIVDIYKPVYSQTGVKVNDESWTLAYSDIPCFIDQRSEYDANGDIGRANQDIVFTTDIIHFHMDQEMESTWKIQIKTEGHPDYGKWEQLLGNSQTRGFRAMESLYFAKSAEKPQRII